MKDFEMGKEMSFQWNTGCGLVDTPQLSDSRSVCLRFSLTKLFYNCQLLKNDSNTNELCL